MLPPSPVPVSYTHLDVYKRQYLLHENIGWSLQLQLQALGVPTDATILLVLATRLALATAITRWVEQPALLWIRTRYRNRLAFAN